MFDIGFLELMIIGIIALLVMGPDRLPGAIRTAMLWIGRIRRSFQSFKADIEEEIDADHIRRQLHNESIMQSLQQAKDFKDDIQHSVDSLQHDINDAVHTDSSKSTK